MGRARSSHSQLRSSARRFTCCKWNVELDLHSSPCQGCPREAQRGYRTSQVTQQVNGRSAECELRSATRPLSHPVGVHPVSLSAKTARGFGGGPTNISHRPWRCPNHTLFYVSLILQAKGGNPQTVEAAGKPTQEASREHEMMQLL